MPDQVGRIVHGFRTKPGFSLEQRDVPMEKSIAAHWLALQSRFFNHAQHLVTGTRNQIGRIMISIGRTQRPFESSNMLVQNGPSSNGPATHWLVLERHFANHAEQVARFRTATRSAARRMWKTQTNEYGAPLSDSERKALIERHCELFGSWPL